MIKNNKYPLSIHQILFISSERYRPNIPKKIIEKEGLYYLNTVIPHCEYLMLEGETENEPKATLDLFFNLLGEKYENLQYFL